MKRAGTVVAGIAAIGAALVAGGCATRGAASTTRYLAPLEFVASDGVDYGFIESGWVDTYPGGGYVVVRDEGWWQIAHGPATILLPDGQAIRIEAGRCLEVMERRRQPESATPQQSEVEP